VAQRSKIMRRKPFNNAVNRIAQLVGIEGAVIA
jgi:hypothetical protein